LYLIICLNKNGDITTHEEERLCSLDAETEEVFYVSLDFNKRKQQKSLINTLSTVVERI